MDNFKINPFRSKKYLVWVKQLPCAICGAPADDAHHIIGIGNMGGTGTKAPDNMSFPLCRWCHGVYHRDSSLWPKQWEYICRTIDLALSEGILIVK